MMIDSIKPGRLSSRYLNSIYTRKRGLGKMNLTIQSWTKGPQETLNKTFAKTLGSKKSLRLISLHLLKSIYFQNSAQSVGTIY